MNYIVRDLEAVVRQVTKEYPVVLVTGPKQVGKTAILQKMMEGTDRGYVSLDDLINFILERGRVPKHILERCMIALTRFHKQ